MCCQLERPSPSVVSAAPFGGCRPSPTTLAGAAYRDALIEEQWLDVDDNRAMTDTSDLAKDPDFQRHTYKMLAASAVFLVASGTVIFSLLEDWSLVDSFYFCVVTVTTVGFGDITPDTDVAKLVSVVYIVFGISIISTFLDARLKKHAYERSSRVEGRSES